MPCVSQFDVRPAVKEWNTRVQRRPRHNRDVQKFMSQEYVSSFFGTASKSNCIEQPKVKF